MRKIVWWHWHYVALKLLSDTVSRPINTFSCVCIALEKEMATHSSVLVWRIPGTGEPHGLLSMEVTQSWTRLKRLSSSSSSSCMILGCFLSSLEYHFFSNVNWEICLLKEFSQRMLTSLYVKLCTIGLVNIPIRCNREGQLCKLQKYKSWETCHRSLRSRNMRLPRTLGFW